MAYKSSFFSLDELRQKRNGDFEDRVSQAAKLFGQAPLTLDSLQKAAADRQMKQEQALLTMKGETQRQANSANAEQRAAEDQGFERDEKDQKKTQTALASYVAGKTAAGVDPGSEQFLAGARESPALGDVADDNTVMAEVKKQKLAEDDAKATQDYKKGLIGVRSDSNAIRADQAKTRADLAAQGWQRIALEKESQRLRALLGGKFATSGLGKQLAEVDTEIAGLNALRDFRAENEIQSGIGPEAWARFRAWVKMPSAERAQADVMASALSAGIVHAFAGSAQTATELAMILKTLPDGFTPEAAWQAAMTAAIEHRKHIEDGILNTLALDPAFAESANAIPRREGTRGARPAAPKTPPGGAGPAGPQTPSTGAGQVTLTSPEGKVRTVDADKVDFLISRGWKK